MWSSLHNSFVIPIFGEQESPPPKEELCNQPQEENWRLWGCSCTPVVCNKLPKVPALLSGTLMQKIKEIGQPLLPHFPRHCSQKVGHRHWKVWPSLYVAQGGQVRCWLVLVCPCVTDLLLFDVLFCFFQIAQLQSNRGSISGSLPFYQRSLMKKKKRNKLYTKGTSCFSKISRRLSTVLLLIFIPERMYSWLKLVWCIFRAR